MELKPTGVSPDGTRHWEVTGLPGAPKEIPGIKKRATPDWMMAGSGRDLTPRRPPKVGEKITVDTDKGRISVRVANVRGDGAMMGTVERLYPPTGIGPDINGIRQKDSVIVRSMDFVTIVETS